MANIYEITQDLLRIQSMMDDPELDEQVLKDTMEAVEAALRLLDNDGILLTAVYPGHKEGELEGEMLSGFFSALSRSPAIRIFSLV